MTQLHVVGQIFSVSVWELGNSKLFVYFELGTFSCEFLI